jgi:hypothetical protein
MSDGPAPGREFPSDAPLRSEVVSLPAGGLGLRRTLDEPWQHDDLARAAFRIEMETAAKLPGERGKLARVVEAGEQPWPWLTREFSEAGTLRDRLRVGPALSDGELVSALTTTLLALEELHRIGLAHGDPCPGNLLLTADGDVRLADPMSGRRLFAEGQRAPSPSQERRTDRRVVWVWTRATAWAAALAGPGSAASRLVKTLDDSGEDEGEIQRLWDWCSQNAALARPIAAPASENAPDPVAVAPVPVALAVGPVSDKKTLYLASKALARRMGRSPGDVSAGLEKSALVFNLDFPHPARDLQEELKSLGVPARLRSLSPLPVARRPGTGPAASERGT